MEQPMFVKDERSQLVSLYIVCAIAEFTNYMVNLGLVYHLASRFGLDAFAIGLVSSIGTASYLIFCLLGESLYERLRPAVCISFSLVGMGLCFAVMGFCSNLALFASMLFIFGGFRSMLWPQITGLINRGKEGAALSKAQGGFNLSWSVSSGIGPLFAGLIMQVSTSIVFLVASGLLFCSMAALLHSPLTRTAKSDRREIADSGMLDSSTPLRFFSWAGLFLVYIASTATATVLPLHIRDSLGLGALDGGILLSSKGVVISALFIILGMQRWWKFRKSVLLLSQVLLCVSLWIGGGADSFAMCMLYCLFLGGSFALIYTQALFYAMSGAVNKSKRMMIHEVVLTIGAVAGSSIGGYLYRQSGWGGLIDTVMKAFLCVFAVELLVMHYMHRNNVADEVSHFNDKDFHAAGDGRGKGGRS